MVSGLQATVSLRLKWWVDSDAYNTGGECALLSPQPLAK